MKLVSTAAATAAAVAFAATIPPSGAFSLDRRRGGPSHAKTQRPPPPAGGAAPPDDGDDTSFVSPAYRVYIEDTDAYGVMYNGNYIRSYERALSHVVREGRSSWIVSSVTCQKFRSSPALGEEYVVRGVLIPSVEDVVGRRVDRVKVEVWQLEMATRRENNNNTEDDGDDVNDGRNDDDNGDDKKWIVHNSATVSIANTLFFPPPNENKMAKTLFVSDIDDMLTSHQQPLDRAGGGGDDEGASGTTFEQRCSAYHDEFDTHYFSHRHRQQQHQSSSSSSTSYFRPHSILPIRNVMNFFERARSNYLGGPNMLRKMQMEEDVLWVVTSVDDGKLMGLCNDSNFFDDGEEKGMGTTCSETTTAASFGEENAVDTATAKTVSRREITVRTNFIVKRRGMIVECRHELFMHGDDDYNDGDDVGFNLDDNCNNNNGRRNLLAKATVTVMALKGSTRRPTSKLPQWIFDQIMGTTKNI